MSLTAPYRVVIEIDPNAPSADAAAQGLMVKVQLDDESLQGGPPPVAVA